MPDYTRPASGHHDSRSPKGRHIPSVRQLVNRETKCVLGDSDTCYTRMNPEDVMLSQINQSQKRTHKQQQKNTHTVRPAYPAWPNSQRQKTERRLQEGVGTIGRRYLMGTEFLLCKMKRFLEIGCIIANVLERDCLLKAG